ncbi:MAG: trypsin-like serine protease [Deltaproteobacteria bacterium]|nr:trypsin-like serine protease [Deltaproteobacteria bacterium]
MAALLRPALSLALLVPLLGSCVAEPGAALTRQPIIGGEIDESHPAVVALTVFGGSEFCSGTVIAPRAVLTAAHCIAGGYDPAAILVFFGTTVGGEGTLRRITAATYHPDFSTDSQGYVYNDVAVLTLEEDAPVTPMAWQRTPLADPSGKTVTFVGYGVTDARTQSGNDTRRTVDGVVSSLTDNYVHFDGNGVSGTCQGDSGGPTFLDQNGVETVIAVTSIGVIGCVSESDNTRVDIHADFIAPLAPMPVTLAVSEPTEGAFVGQDFTVAVDAASPAGVTVVALLLDGAPLVSTAEPPYTFDLTSIPDGDHLLSLQATGADGGHGAVDVWVTVATQEVGVACSADAECRSGICAEAGSAAGGFCTKACTTNADCPADAACNPVAGGQRCGRPGSDSGGCAAGGRADGSAGGLLGVLVLALAAGHTLGRRGPRRRGGIMVLLAALAVLVAACGDNVKVYQVDASYPVHTRPQNDAAVVEPQLDGGAPSGIGEACTSDVDIGQGTCAADLICITADLTDGLAANGYCTVPCGEGLGCPWDSTCVAGTAHSMLCLRTCADASGCRTADGYHCMEKSGAQVCWNWIVPPGTNDGGACSSPDGGPYVNAAGRRFGESQQLLPSDGGIVESQTLVVAKGTTVAASFASSASSFGGGRVAVTASQDQGVTFGPAVVVQDSVTSRKSDPILAIDPSGAHLYLGWVGYDRSGGSTTNMRVFVARSDDAGLTWPTAQIHDATTTDSGTGTVARPWLAAGPNGTVYVAYVLGAGSSSIIKVARSSDLGATWDAPVRVDDPARTPSARGLPHVAANGAGDVFVGWGEVGLGVPNGDAANDVFVARGDAGGTWGTFGPNVKGSADADLVVSNGLAVVPSVAGTKLYLVYVAGPPDSQRWDVRLTWSDDRGDTFSASSIKINDDRSCAIHVLPAAAIDAADRLHVVWYDNRFGTEEGGFYYSRWDPVAGAPSASEFVSDATFAYSTEPRASNRLGNYAGVAVDGTYIYATWADSRGVTNTSHVRFAQGTLP